MAKSKLHRLGDLQLRIMKILWNHKEATVAQVLESLGSQTLFAYTTIATMLRKMEARGLVAHRAEGRSFMYRARVAAQDVTQDMADDLLERLFEGSLADMVSHLLTAREISRAELTRLEKLIEERKKAL